MRKDCVKFTLVMLSICLLLGCSKRQLGKEEMLFAYDRISVQMGRAEIESIVQESVEHQLCAYDETISAELYLFGSKELGSASTIYVVYEEINGEDVAIQIAAPSADFLEMPTFNDCRSIDQK